MYFNFKTLTLHGAYYVPETALNTSQTWIYIISIIILWDRNYYPYFADGKLRAKDVEYFPKITQLVNGRASIEPRKVDSRMQILNPSIAMWNSAPYWLQEFSKTRSRLIQDPKITSPSLYVRHSCGASF